MRYDIIDGFYDAFGSFLYVYQCIPPFSILFSVSPQYYEKDGEMRPGKKGISLNKDQYDVLAALFKSGSINAEVAKLVK